jgi:methionyl-tRNA formyltransferase
VVSGDRPRGQTPGSDPGDRPRGLTPLPLRVVYFGTPEFAVPTLRALIESRHPVVALVSQPDRPRGRGHHTTPTPTKQLATEHGIRVLQPVRLRDTAFLDELRAVQPDLGVVAAYGRILPDELLALPRLGMINVHASLLPAYRGAAPIHRAVIAGDAETGVTIMRVVKELDAGPMMSTVRRPIGSDETSVDVEHALAELGARALVDVVERIADGSAVEVPQDDAQATHAAKIAREEGAVEWSLSAAEIHNRVRGLQPWPLVAVRIGGARYKIHRTTPTGDRTDAAPGTIVSVSADGIGVATGGGGVLRIDQIQPEGRRVMSARDFLSGHTLEPGTHLTPA